MSTCVLLVDDEPQIRRILRAYFEADNFDVLEAGTGAEAVQPARRKTRGSRRRRSTTEGRSVTGLSHPESRA